MYHSLAYYLPPSTTDMADTILTPRLKLHRITTLESGSTDLAHAHIVRSSPEATTWRYVCLFLTTQYMQYLPGIPHNPIYLSEH